MRKFQPFIHVSQPIIQQNRKNGTDLPVLTCKLTSKGQSHAHEVIIMGQDGKPAARIVTNGNPKSCGARCWIEPLHKVELVMREATNGL